jgi:hypothetical protein
MACKGVSELVKEKRGTKGEIDYDYRRGMVKKSPLYLATHLVVGRGEI